MFTDLKHECVAVSYLNAFKDVFKGPWDDAFLGYGFGHPLHGERLAASSLSIGKNCAIVSFSDPL